MGSNTKSVVKTICETSFSTSESAIFGKYAPPPPAASGFYDMPAHCRLHARLRARTPMESPESARPGLQGREGREESEGPRTRRLG
jgi:hypothetical protein